MKKTLIALAAVAVSSAAMAQATISGVLGYGYTQASAATSAAKPVASWGQTDGNIVLSGTEDLGGGLKASFRAQIDISGTRGGAAGSADRSLSLAGGFGTVTMANSRSGNAAVSAAGISGASLADDAWGDAGGDRRVIDGVTYTSPNISGLTASVSMLQLAANVNNNEATVASDATKLNAYSVQYSTGPLAVGITLKQPKLSSAASTTEINASYNMGFARVAFGNVKTEDVKATNAFGVSVPMGAITLGAGHIKSATKKYTDYSVAYSLSKRTTARASFGKPDADKRSQSRFNIVHTF